MPRQNIFTPAEVATLLRVLKKYKNIIDCKKTDSASIKQKDEVWERITNEFNACCDTGREIKELKTKYKNVKYATKAKARLMTGDMDTPGSSISDEKDRLDCKDLAGIDTSDTFSVDPLWTGLKRSSHETSCEKLANVKKKFASRKLQLEVEKLELEMKLMLEKHEEEMQHLKLKQDLEMDILGTRLQREKVRFEREQKM